MRSVQAMNILEACFRCPDRNVDLELRAARLNLAFDGEMASISGTSRPSYLIYGSSFMSPNGGLSSDKSVWACGSSCEPNQVLHAKPLPDRKAGSPICIAAHAENHHRR